MVARPQRVLQFGGANVELMMGLKIVCSGSLIRYPVGGFTWHHLQYLLGFHQLGHHVTYFEDFGWRQSCYDLERDVMTADPSYGIAYLLRLLRPYGLEDRWCYLAEDGSSHGLSRERLTRLCRECDLYVNLSNVNWIPELEDCHRRVLVDTDPVFTQVGALGMDVPLTTYQTLFTYGANVHNSGCDMPTAGAHWVPTRQPIVLDLWPVQPGEPSGPFTTVANWAAVPDFRHGDKLYGQKDREFEPYFTLPRDTGQPMEIAVSCEPKVCDPNTVLPRLATGGWRLADTYSISRDPWTFQRYVVASRAEFSVAKHGYVVTRSGWFSDRSATYLASGRPVVLQDTGFSDWLPTGVGVIAFRTRDEAVGGIEAVNSRYEFHCRAAREIAEEYFDARKVLSRLIDQAMNAAPIADAGSPRPLPGLEGE